MAQTVCVILDDAETVRQLDPAGLVVVEGVEREPQEVGRLVVRQADPSLPCTEIGRAEPALISRDQAWVVGDDGEVAVLPIRP